MKLPLRDKLTLDTPTAYLAFLAGVSGLVYLIVFTVPFPLAEFYRTIPPVDYAKLTHHSVAGLVAYLVGLGVLFAFYGEAIRQALPRTDAAGHHSPPVSIDHILIAGAVLAGILIFSYPVTAIDLFIYAIRSRGWALYGLNPLATAPAKLPSADPWLGLAAEWAGSPSPYGPLWEWLSLGVFYLGGGNFLAHLFALKILAALAYLGCAWLVYKILRCLRPDWAAAGAIAFAWSPLVLLESVQNGHNDIVMVFFLLAAVWVFIRWPANSHSRTLLPGLGVCLGLALSILVKFVTLIVAPFFLLALAGRSTGWRRQIAALLSCGLALALLVIVPMWPFWPGWENWAVWRAGSGAGRSLLALLVLALRDVAGLSAAFDLARYLILVILALIYLTYLWQTLAAFPTSPSPLRFLSPSFFTLFWYVLLAAPVFHAWYLLWFLPLAALLLPDRRPLRATIVFSITALLVIPYFETLRVWYPALLYNQLLGHLIGVPLLIGPPALTLLWPIRPGKQSEV